MTTIIRMQATGAPSVLLPASAAVGAPGPGQVRLRQQAVGVNYVDTMVRDGRFPVPLPAVPGFEGAGVVDAVGPGVTGLRPGQRAAYFFAAGAYAGERLVEAAALVPLPDDIDAEHAAAFLAKGLTAWMGLRALHRVQPGQRILVQGASGSVGAILARWARAMGATVIGVAGSRARLDKVRDGADHALAADDPDVLQQLRAIAPGGVDVVYDFVGQAVLGLSLAALRDGGTFVAIGAASGQPQLDPATLAQRGIVLRAGGTPQYVTPANAADAAGELFQAMRDGLFKDLPIVRYPLEQAAQVHEAIGRRALDGLAVLIPPPAASPVQVA
jgi:NADPH2:quinone reductase